MTTRSETPVLVVGAGPVGLTLACELRRHGVSCRIIDKNATGVKESRATGIQARTLEMLDDMGLVEAFLARGVRSTNVHMFDGAKRVATVDVSKVDSPYAVILGLEQWYTERLLNERLETLDGRIERGVELVRFDEDPDGVSSVLLHPDGTWERVRSSWLVGCDGANSTIRRMLSLPLEGTTYEERFLIADVRLEWEIPHADVATVWADGDFVMALPIPGERMVRLFLNDPDEDAAERSAPSLDVLRQAFFARVPMAAELHDLVWSSRFRSHKRMVSTYRVGRTFLAGDAAHIHSPISGQGMNLGMQDAYNLAWKLALVVGGRAFPTMLDSYEEERKPLAVDVLSESDLGTRAAMLEGWLATGVRNQLLSTMLRFPSIQKRMLDMGSELSWNYRASRLSAEARPPLVLANVRHDPASETASVRDWMAFGAAPRAGDRVPDVQLARGVRLFDVLRGTPHTLLLFDGRSPTDPGYAHLVDLGARVQSRFGSSVRVKIVVCGAKPPASLARHPDILLDDEERLHARFGAGAECLYLARPDGYVAFRSQPADGEALLSHLDRYMVGR